MKGSVQIIINDKKLSKRKFLTSYELKAIIDLWRLVYDWHDNKVEIIVLQK